MYNYTYIPCLALRSVADVTRTLRIPVIYSSSINDKNYSNPQLFYYICLLLIATKKEFSNVDYFMQQYCLYKVS